MTETRFRLLMGFFLCTAIGLLTLSEISLAQPKEIEPGPDCMMPRADFGGVPAPLSGTPHGRLTLPPAPGLFGMSAPPLNLQQLDLSEAQQDQVFALGHEQLPRVREQLKIAEKARKALLQLPLSQPFDKAKAQSLAQTQADAMAKVAVLHAELEASIRALLTPDQRQQLDRPEPCPHRPAP